jgi:hypothetical protein
MNNRMDGMDRIMTLPPSAASPLSVRHRQQAGDSGSGLGRRQMWDGGEACRSTFSDRMPETSSSLSIVRHANGLITILKGRPPRLGAGRGFGLPAIAGLVSGVVFSQIAPLVGWHLSVLDTFGLPMVLAGLGYAVVRLWQHRHQPDRIELDWRREELRAYDRRGVTTTPFGEIGGVIVTSRWADETDGDLAYAVVAEAAGESLLLGHFEAEESAREWAAELNALLGR